MWKFELREKDITGLFLAPSTMHGFAYKVGTHNLPEPRAEHAVEEHHSLSRHLTQGVLGPVTRPTLGNVRAFDFCGPVGVRQRCHDGFRWPRPAAPTFVCASSFRLGCRGLRGKIELELSASKGSKWPLGLGKMQSRSLHPSCMSLLRPAVARLQAGSRQDFVA